MISRGLGLLLAGALVTSGCNRGADQTVSSVPRTTPTTEATTTSTEAPPTGPPASSTPQAAADAAGLAAQINTAEATIRNPAATAEELRQAGHTAQVAYRAAVVRPEWMPDILKAVSPALRDSVAANVNAGWLLRSMITKPKDTLPDWHIVTPEPVEELISHYKGAEAEFDVPWQYLAAVNLVETRMGRIRGVSSAGAEGPMQFLPSTWAAYGDGGDINSYRDAIRAAARYLKANGAPTNMRSALWNYNHSYKYVDAVTQYAEQMKAEPRAIYGYYHWQVYYLTSGGDVLLPEGWTRQ